MSADELMDARLQAAGQRWRSAHESDAVQATILPSSIPPVHDLIASARTRRNRWSYFATAAAVLVVGGGATALIVTTSDDNSRIAAGPGQGLVGTMWNLVGITDANGAKIAVASKATLSVGSDGTLAGRDGCNMISGLVTVTATSIELQNGGLATTEIGCLSPAVQAEATAVDQILVSSKAAPLNYTVAAEQLTLTRSGAGTLVYEPSVVTQSTKPADLAGKWELNSIEEDSGNNGSASGSSEYANIKVAFDGDGHITITHQCYTNAGSAQIGSGTIDISGVTLSLALPCPSTVANAMESENATVDGVLTGHVTWQIADGQLKITNGARALAFVRPDSTTTSVPTPTGPDALLGTWTLTGYSTSGGKASHTTSPTPTYHLTFAADGKFSVSAAKGGNDLSGTYRVEGQTLAFTVSGAAPQGCAAEHQLVTALTSGPTWFVKADTMSLVLGDSLELGFIQGATDPGGAVQGC